MQAFDFRRTSSLALALLALLAGSGRSAGQSTAPTAGAPSKAEIEALFRARTDSARMNFTAADVGFMSGMIVHHTQALIMAGMAPTHGAGGPVQTLCARIINAQQDEIATMRQWLRDRGQPVPEVQVSGTSIVVRGGMRMDMSGRAADSRQARGMPGMSMPATGQDARAAPADHPLMPGMLTDAQMSQLDRARGADFDRLFLEGMIQHHAGAIGMVHALFATPGAGQDEAVFKFANDVQVDQSTEIARMQRMLAALPATTTP